MVPNSPMEELRYVWMEFGPVSALISGMIKMPVWSAHSWAFIPKVNVTNIPLCLCFVVACYCYYHTDAVATNVFGFGEAGPVLLNEVHCFGNESKLLNCQYLGPEELNCTSNEKAGVICDEGGQIEIVDSNVPHDIPCALWQASSLLAPFSFCDFVRACLCFGLKKVVVQ